MVDIIKPGRGVGNTTRQMEGAPQRAVFIWVNDHLGYPRDLARRLGREDLEIVTPRWLEDCRWMGRELSGVVLDHAARLTWREWNLYEKAKARVRLA